MAVARREGSDPVIIIWLSIFACAGCAATVIGGVALYGCLCNGCRAVESAEALVVGHHVSEDEEGRYFAPIIAFTWQGREHRVVGSSGRAGAPDVEVGRRVMVHFPSGTPEEATIGHFPGLVFAVLPLVVGLWLLIGVGVEIRRLWR